MINIRYITDEYYNDGIEGITPELCDIDGTQMSEKKQLNRFHQRRNDKEMWVYKPCKKLKLLMSLLDKDNQINWIKSNDI